MAADDLDPDRQAALAAADRIERGWRDQWSYVVLCGCLEWRRKAWKALSL
jgi:hypothetical protein